MNKNNVLFSFLPQKKHPHYKSKPEMILPTKSASSFDENHKFLKEFLSKNKQNSNILAKPSNQNHNPNHIFSKSKAENSCKGYLTSGFKTEYQSEVPSIISKIPNHCVIQINIHREKIRFNIDCSDKTSEWLVALLIEKIREFEKQNKKENTMKPLIGFANTTGFILIDYLLTLKNFKMDFLENMIMVFDPIFADVNFLKSTHSRQSLKNFQFLRLIGSGGFSKVFLGKTKLTF